jgi:hypothetical protein
MISHKTDTSVLISRVLGVAKYLVLNIGIFKFVSTVSTSPEYFLLGNVLCVGIQLEIKECDYRSCFWKNVKRIYGGTRRRGEVDNKKVVTV